MVAEIASTGSQALPVCKLLFATGTRLLNPRQVKTPDTPKAIAIAREKPANCFLLWATRGYLPIAHGCKDIGHLLGVWPIPTYPIV